MPATKDAMTRYRILDELLSNRYKQYSLDDLTEEVCNRMSDLNPDSNGVTRRCIEKDIQYLEYDSPFMVEIDRYKVPSYNHVTEKYYTKHCLRYKKATFSIFKKDLSNDEEYLLKSALQLLGQFEGLPGLDALEKLRWSLSVQNDDRQIISFTKSPIEQRNVLGELFVCISQRQVVELNYHKFGENQDSKKCKVYPYLLKEYNRRWFLFAAACSDKKLLCFALDRIDGVEPLPSYKYMPYEGNWEDRFKDIVGVTLLDNEVKQHIVFWISDFEKAYVKSKPIHHTQDCCSDTEESELRERYPQCQGGAFFYIDCIRNYELIRELSSFGGELVVLSPSLIRDEIYERTRKMTNRYEEIR